MKVETVYKPDVHITLTWEEAETLNRIVGNIGCPSHKSKFSALVNNLYDEFKRIGIESYGTPFEAHIAFKSEE